MQNTELDLISMESGFPLLPPQPTIGKSMKRFLAPPFMSWKGSRPAHAHPGHPWAGSNGRTEHGPGQLPQWPPLRVGPLSPPLPAV